MTSGRPPEQPFPAEPPRDPANPARSASGRFVPPRPQPPPPPASHPVRSASGRIPPPPATHPARSGSGVWVTPPAPPPPGAAHRSSERFAAVPPPAAATQPSPAQAPPGRSKSDRVGLVRVGPYELLNELGRGSSGTVYLARRPGIERLFALKLLPQDLDPEGQARLEREAKVASRIEHPGVVPAVDVGVHEGRQYMVMEHVPGETLRDHLARRGGHLPWAEARDLVASLAEAMQAAHDAGVVHRDLKPANVLLDARDSRPRVTDFGLARDTASAMSLTREGDVIGTPYYMSPEQVQGRRADPRTDVYGLGVILYELLSGERPFQAQNVAGLVEKILRERPLPPRKRRPEIPAAIEQVCLKAMAREPAQRYASARELERALREATVVAEPAGAGRRPLVLLGACALALAALPSLLVITLGADGNGEAIAAEAQVVQAREERRARQAQAALRQAALRERRVEAADPPERGGEVLEQQEQMAQLELDELLRWEVAVDGHMGVVLDRLIEQLRTQPGCAALTAALLRNRGRYDDALQVIRTAREAGDEDPELWVAEFRTDTRLGREPEAMAALQELARREPPDSARGVFARAILGELPPAEVLPALQRAQEAEPGLAWLHIFAGMRHIQLGSPAAALQALARALAIDPTSPDARQLRMEAMLRQWDQRPPAEGELEQLLCDARDWREIRPDAEAWLLCGVALVRAGQPLAGLRELEEARRRARPDDRAIPLSSTAWALVACLHAREAPAARTVQEELERLTGEPEAQAAALAGPAAWLERADPQAHEALLRTLPGTTRAMLAARRR